MTKICTRIISVLLILCAISTVFITVATSAAPRTTAPTIGNVAIESITDVSASVVFTVDQSDASAIVHYGATRAMTKRSVANTDVSFTRSIILSGLSAGTNYFFLCICR